MRGKSKHLFITLAVGLGLTLALLWLLDGTPPVAHADPGTRYVAPGGDCGGVTPCCATIQAAVDAVVPGDVIKIAAGTYTDVNVRPRNDITTTSVVTQVVYVSKTVTIRGGYTTTNWTTSNPETNHTTLDAQGKGRVLYITGSISPTIEGLRIIGGDATGLGGNPWGHDCGGGVYIITATAVISDNQVLSNTAQVGGGLFLSRSPAKLSNNTVTANTADDFGGGLLLDCSDVTLSNNTVTANHATNSGGGGLHLYNSSATLTGNTVISNATGGSGGGLRLESSAAMLNSNTVTSNTANYGGGLRLLDSAATFSGNTVASNTAYTHSGGLFLENSDATLTGNIVTANTAGDFGGGLLLVNSDATFNGNVVSFNTANNGNGGGLYLYGSDAALINNIAADNQANTAGSGLYIAGSSPRLLHTTITRNKGGDGSGVYVTEDFSSNPSNVALTNTILVSHSVGISVTGGNTVTINGVLWYDVPITVSQSITATVSVQNQRTGDPAFAADGYHITPASTAMDAGIYAGVTTDIDGHHRPYNSVPDLGADEIIATSAPTDTESTLVYTDTQGSPTVIQVPGGAVTTETTLVYTPVETATAPSGFYFVGHAFDLDAYRNDVHLPGFTFEKPVSFTLHYAEADVAGLDEDSLELEHWNESTSAWEDAACGDYDRHPDENWLTVPICHLSQFALFGEREYLIYLPLVLRNYGP